MKLTAGREKGIMLGFRSGDEKAFAALYEQFYLRAYFFALRFVGESDARDVTAESFIKLWEKRAGFQDIRGVSSFLFVSIKNRCFDLLRHEEVRTKAQAELLTLLDAVTENDMHIEQVKAELIQLVYQEVETLPAKMKSVINLSFKYGLKPAEIARQLGISVQTVSNQKLTALKILRKAVSHRLEILGIFLFLSGRF